jgi:adenylosuccinate lyase
LLAESQMSARGLESLVMHTLDLDPFLIATQTYSRRQDWAIVSALAGCGMTLYKFAFDLRLLQSPPLGEWNEPFGQHQVGSSAMPFKRNPINAENMDSLARYLAALPGVAWDNGAHNLLERTLDDSGNRRLMLPEAFLISEELLKRARRILGDLRLNRETIWRNFSIYGPFAATERLLMAAVRAGGNRQDLHEVIRQHSLDAWAALQAGQPNPLAETLSADPVLIGLLPAETIRQLLNADAYVGDAPQRAREMAGLLRENLE